MAQTPAAPGGSTAVDPHSALAPRVHSPRPLVEVLLAGRSAPRGHPDAASGPRDEPVRAVEPRRFSDVAVGALVIAALILALAFALLFE